MPLLASPLSGAGGAGAGAVVVSGGRKPGRFLVPGIPMGSIAARLKPKPSPDQIELEHWLNDAMDGVIDVCPLDRARTIYFAPNGDDSLSVGQGGGTMDKPWRSIARACDVIGGSNGNIAAAFLGGGRYTQPQGFFWGLNAVPGVTIKTWGPAGKKAVFDRGFLWRPGNYWHLVPGTANVYKCADSGGVTAVFIRRRGVVMLPMMMRPLLSPDPAVCDANPGSWYVDPDDGLPCVHGLFSENLGLEYINGYEWMGGAPAGIDNGVGAGYNGLRTDGTGGVRVDGIRFEGFGSGAWEADEQGPNGKFSGKLAYAFHVIDKAGGYTAITNCGGHIGGRHNAVVGGVVAIDNFESDIMTHDEGGIIVLGGRQVFVRDYRIGTMKLQRGTQPYAGGEYGGSGPGMFAHPSADNPNLELLAVIDPVIVNPDYQFAASGAISSVGTTDMASREADPKGETAKAYVVGCRQYGREPQPLDATLGANPNLAVRIGPAENAVHLRCVYAVTAVKHANVGDDGSLIYPTGGRTVAYRCIRIDDLSKIHTREPANLRSAVHHQAPAGALNFELYGGVWIQRMAGGTYTTLGAFLRPDLAGAAQGDAAAKGVTGRDAYMAQFGKLVVQDSIVAWEGTYDAGVLGMLDDGERLKNNVYVNIPKSSGLSGVGADPFATFLASYKIGVPAPDSPLLSANTQRPIAYDFDGNPTLVFDDKRGRGLY